MKVANGNLKKVLVAVIIFVLAVMMVACNYKPATDNGTNGGSSSSGTSGGSGSVSNGDVFTVKLSESIPYAYLSEIKAIWTDTESQNDAFYSASFDKNGVAQVSGLDGDFKVTLSTTPSGYTYNPNIYFVNNESKDVTIKLYKLSSVNNPTATGLTSDDPFVLSSTGAYRAVLTAQNFEGGLWFMYKPTYEGDYSFESMIDVTANKLNPILDQHGGNSGGYVNLKVPTMTVDGGGEENTYTKNFRWELNISGFLIGNVYYFHIYATTLDKGVFPLMIDFILDRNGEFTGGDGSIEWDTVEVTHDFDALASIAFSDMNGSFTEYGKFDGNNNVLVGSRVIYAGDGAKTDEEAKANDYYYVMDSKGNKKILYAKITVDNIVVETESGMGFTDALNIPRKIVGKDDAGNQAYYNYKEFIETYANHVVNGCYPVTKELQLFLQRYSISKRLFNDGNGMAEYNEEGVLFLSSESNQWLFAVGVFA